MRKSLWFEAVLVLLIIALLSVLYVAVSDSPGSRQGEGWTLSGIIAPPSTSYFFPTYSGNMFAGDDGMLYTIDGRHVNAIAGNGSLLWRLAIPDRYIFPSLGNESGTISLDSGLQKKTYREEIKNDVLTTSGQPWSSDSAVVVDSHLYILVKTENPVILNGALLSIASDGSLQWSLPFGGGYTEKYHYQYGLGYPASVILHDGVLYVYAEGAGGGVTRVALNGSIVGYVGNVRDKPAIGDNGALYILNGDYPWSNGSYSMNAPLIEAYDSDGTLKWQHSFTEYGINESMMPLAGNQPYLRNDTLYLWSNDGVAALDLNGSLKFRYHLPEGYLAGCGFDQHDTLYLSYCTDPRFSVSQKWTGVVILRPDGTVVTSLYADDSRYGLGGIKELPDGVLYGTSRVMSFSDGSTHESGLFRYFQSADYPIPEYYTTYNDGLVKVYLKNNTGKWDFPRGLGNLDTYDVTARDMVTGELLWSYRLPLVPHNVVLDRDNAASLTFSRESIADDNAVPETDWYAHYGIPLYATGIRADSWAGQLMGNNTVYVYMWSYNYEYPPIYHKARCVYSGGIYAFGLNGKLLWSLPTDSRVVSVHEVNGTIYYGTGGGKVSAARAGVAAGIVTAAVYLFFRFFLLGGVTRARARLERNPNRTSVLQYIKDNPGVTLFDAAEGLEMNPGTVRYHLMILGLNHRITSFRADEKFVRYFVNSGAYGPGDQLVISMMRREPLRKIVSLLAERPGLSNVELSRALDVQESSTMRNVKLLMEKGIVTKSLMPDGKIAYSLSSEYIITVVTEFCARVKTCA